ncbi:uncharacterized protein [Rutidosis leptorrhynchoides]|uniref:uncharacterized protein n=1 Tax=Rutidosis leptorrhynchoides TaxID=125765 RepID=UPI003A9A140F
MVLKDKFNRLYRLDTNKFATILDRARWEGGNFHATWCWSRDISGRLAGDLTTLTNLLSSFVPCSSGKEEWSWSWSKDGSFSVHKLTDILVQSSPDIATVSIKSLRNKLVPLKVELFIWRTRHKRLPTRVELDKRGMDLGTVRCPVCDNGLESVEHSIILCTFAFDIWNRVYDWWKLGPFTNLGINESFLGNGYNFTSDLGKLLWQATEWVTGYMIWKSRNAFTFTKIKPTCAMVFKDIQLKCFEWISNRIKGTNIEWDVWLANPRGYDSLALSSRRSGIG